MRFLSGFSGIEAASVAWLPLGWECAAVMETDPAACALLRHHYHDVPNLGDVATISADDLRRVGPIDLFVFGWPCQDLSVAGKREGLKGERSGLIHDAARILRLAAEHCGCRWFVAENVPGLFSSHGGRDFREVLRTLTGLALPVPRDGWGNGGVAARNDGGWSLAWRVLDSQFFGVPQRRRRVFLVGCPGDWTRAASVLFEPESLCGDPPPRRQAGARVAACLDARTRAGGFPGSDGACGGHVVPDVAGFSTSGAGYWRDGLGTVSARSFKDGEDAGLVAHTLRADGFDASEDGTGRGTPLVAFDTTQITHPENRCNPKPGDPCHPLAAKGHAPAIAGSAVRRLTPCECERLMGLPDEYTLVPYRDKPMADGPRYKLLGNSFAVPVVRWIGRRIQLVEESAR